MAGKLIASPISRMRRGRERVASPPTQRTRLTTVSERDLLTRLPDEPRRSGRATKGQHTKDRDLPDAPPAAKRQKDKPEPSKKKGAKGKGQEPEEEEDEEAEDDDAVIRCVCGVQEDDGERQMICCDKCEVWQHLVCLGLDEGNQWDDKTYFCEICKPEDHKELLAAVSRGERPWERWNAEWRDRKKKGKKGKAKGKGARHSEVRSTKSEEASTPKPQAPAAATPEESKPQVAAEDTNGHGKVGYCCTIITYGC